MELQKSYWYINAYFLKFKLFFQKTFQFIQILHIRLIFFIPRKSFRISTFIFNIFFSTKFQISRILCIAWVVHVFETSHIDFFLFFYLCVIHRYVSQKQNEIIYNMFLFLSYLKSLNGSWSFAKQAALLLKYVRNLINMSDII